MSFRHEYSFPIDRGFDIPSSKQFKEGLTKVEISYFDLSLTG